MWFSLGFPVFSTNKTDRHDITKILLKVVFLNTITLTRAKDLLHDIYIKRILTIDPRFKREHTISKQKSRRPNLVGSKKKPTERAKVYHEKNNGDY